MMCRLPGDSGRYDLECALRALGESVAWVQPTSQQLQHRCSAEGRYRHSCVSLYASKGTVVCQGSEKEALERDLDAALCGRPPMTFEECPYWPSNEMDERAPWARSAGQSAAPAAKNKVVPAGNKQTGLAGLRVIGERGRDELNVALRSLGESPEWFKCTDAHLQHRCVRFGRYEGTVVNWYPKRGSGAGRAIRDVEWEEKIHNLCRDMGIGAQFGGKYFVHDVRVARLPRHGGSCPVGIGVSCSADRQAQARITADGVFLEELEHEPEKYLQVDETQLSSEVHRIDLNANPRAELTKLPVATRVMLTGTMLVARDIAHAQFQAILDRGEDLPKYLLDHPLFYAGPSKTPDGLPSGSFGPTSAVRMDPYVPVLQRRGGSLIMIGKGNRTKEVTKACKQFGGFYLGTIGGMAAQLTSECVNSVEILDMHELGMEAVFRIEVENFPAFIVVDDKGGDFFAKWR